MSATAEALNRSSVAKLTVGTGTVIALWSGSVIHNLLSIHRN